MTHDPSIYDSADDLTLPESTADFAYRAQQFVRNHSGAEWAGSRVMAYYVEVLAGRLDEMDDVAGALRSQRRNTDPETSDPHGPRHQ